MGVGRGTFQQLVGKSSDNGAGARGAHRAVARFLAIALAASVATSVARRRAKTLASFALSGSTLRTIRASRWHQHEIETPSKTGKCFGATDLRCKMPDVAEVVNRGLRRYDSNP